jgi:hypothetical protein
MCDNTTAVTYITAIGGCKSLECNVLAHDIWECAIARNIWLSAAHIPGVSNISADALSRDLNLDLEWMLSRSAFNKVVGLFGQPDIDLFASRLNAQIENYESWKPDPLARYVDAFTVDWSVFFFYAFPPFCLLSRCVHKITQEKASGVLVIPLWPTQPMFSSVLHLLTDVPRVLKANRGNLVHPALVKAHPLHNQLSLLVCKVSGDSSRSLAFQQTLLMSSCSLGDHQRISSTAHTLTNGRTFAVNGRLIPCVPL